jgi:hypothetical protein
MTPTGPYEVFYSGLIRQRVDQLFRRAVVAGIGPRLANALQFIEGHLTLDPAVWGEFIFRLHHMNMDVYQRIHDGLYVVFTVREEERGVWLCRVYPIKGHPIHDPNEPPH